MRQYQDRPHIPPIIVKFLRNSDKDRVIMARKSLKGRAVSIHDDLTLKNKQLLNRVRNDERVETSWSFKGCVRCLLKTGEKFKINISQTIEDAMSCSKRTGNNQTNGKGFFYNQTRGGSSTQGSRMSRHSGGYRPRFSRYPPPRATIFGPTGPNTGSVRPLFVQNKPMQQNDP